MKARAPRNRAIAIARETLALLNTQSEFLSPTTLGSTRAAGDAIQKINDQDEGERK